VIRPLRYGVVKHDMSENYVEGINHMDGHGNEGEENPSLDEQMKGLLHMIEDEPIPQDLRKLALELQAAIERRNDQENSD